MIVPFSVMRRLVLGIGAGISLIGAGVVGLVPASGAPQDKVTICHATSSVRNPDVETSVSEDSIVKPDGTPAGHGLHTGGVFPTPGWGDVIPPFTYTNASGGTSTYPGMNYSSLKERLLSTQRRPFGPTPLASAACSDGVSRRVVGVRNRSPLMFGGDGRAVKAGL